MKRKIFLFLLVPIGIIAQTTNNSTQKEEDFITTDLVSPFFVHYQSGTFYTPRWRLGYIKLLNKKSKIGIDFGYGNANISLINTGSQYSLWEIRPEYYRIINPNAKTTKYFSLELFYQNQKEEFITQYFVSNQNEFLTYDKADYSRQKAGLIPKFGMFINLSKRIGVNLYTGFGIHYRINKYSNFLNLQEILYREEHVQPYYREEGNKIGVEFSFGIKLNYRVKATQFLH